MKQADLHIHTTASDGILSPEEVIEQADVKGLGAVAITDHDTTAGIEPAMLFAEQTGVEVVPGIEFSAERDGRDVHILAYCIEYHNTRLVKLLGKLRRSRLERAEKMVKKLNELGYDILFDKVLETAGGESVGRPHVAKVLEEVGVRKPFDTLIGRGCPAYVPRFKLHPQETIQFIHDMGGVPVIAHPGKSVSDDFLEELIAAGLMGIEVYHPDHGELEVRKYEELALKFNLLITGGSDCHGKEIGMVTVPLFWVLSLKKAVS